MTILFFLFHSPIYLFLLLVQPVEPHTHSSEGIAQPSPGNTDVLFDTFSMTHIYASSILFLLPPPCIFLKKGCSPFSKLNIPSCLLPISHIDDKCPAQDFSLSPQYPCSFSLGPRSCFTALSHPSSEGCKELAKEQRKVEDCSSTPQEPTLPLLPTLLCGALSAGAPPLPTPAPSLQVSGLRYKERGVGGRQGGHINMVLFSLKFTSHLNSLGHLSQPDALLLYPSLPQLW